MNRALLSSVVLALLCGCAAPSYSWYKVREPYPKAQWRYLYTSMASYICRERVGNATQPHACATWHDHYCEMVLPPNAPAWMVQHEERHCLGWAHEE